MRKFSRRDLFSLNRELTLNPVVTEKNTDVVVGRLFDFPLGEQKILPALNIIIESLPEGLRAHSTENIDQYYALKENTSGELVLSLKELWPANRVYSFLTNAPIDLKIASWEDQS